MLIINKLTAKTKGIDRLEFINIGNSLFLKIKLNLINNK